MTDLTPEAVKAALERATPGPWRAHYDEGEYTGEIRGELDSDYDGCIADWVAESNAAIITMAPDLAREYLRLKEVEKAGKELAGYIPDLERSYETEYDGRMYEICSGCGAQLSDGQECHEACEWVQIDIALAAFRAAVEGK